MQIDFSLSLTGSILPVVSLYRLLNQYIVPSLFVVFVSSAKVGIVLICFYLPFVSCDQSRMSDEIIEV